MQERAKIDLYAMTSLPFWMVGRFFDVGNCGLLMLVKRLQEKDLTLLRLAWIPEPPYSRTLEHEQARSLI